MNTSKQQARLGLFYLKEAVLSVLLEAEHEGPIQLAEIRKRLGIPRVEEGEAHSNSLIRGILYHLQHEKRVLYFEGIGVEAPRGWKIADTEASLLQEPSID